MKNSKCRSSLAPVFNNISPDILKAMPYNYSGKNIEIIVETLEFTCLCPWSGLPDFATLNITYTPDKKVIELKSLKYYIHSYRQVGILHEDAVNRITEDLVKKIKPRNMKVEIIFNLRGGIKTTVRREYNKNRS